MVNFHGANKPTGEARTWPHELTREGVNGLEHRQTPEWSRHNTTLPFTRYLVLSTNGLSSDHHTNTVRMA